MENLYKILECTETASVQELKKAYQELALKHHPDKTASSTSNQEIFVRINRAWTILRDSQLREQYDIKWRERCLAQAYPIQDTIHFEEFEKNEEYNEDETIVIGSKDCENTVIKGDKCGETFLSKGVNNDDVLVYGNVTNIGTEQDQKICAEKRTKEKNKVNANREIETEKHESPPIVSQNVTYTFECRCGGNYILTGVDVKLKFDIVCCDTCSLSIKVIYDENDDYNV